MRRILPAMLLAGVVAVSACTDSMMGGGTIVSAITPSGSSTDVDPNAPITVVFSAPMGTGMEAFMALHLGDVTGPVVPGAWAWSQNRTELTFTPAAALEPGTGYAIHMGGGMMDADGDVLDFGHCGSEHGGQWATGGMMGGNGGMMGAAWQHANGTYGMIFGFTTR